MQVRGRYRYLTTVSILSPVYFERSGGLIFQDRKQTRKIHEERMFKPKTEQIGLDCRVTWEHRFWNKCQSKVAWFHLFGTQQSSRMFYSWLLVPRCIIYKSMQRIKLSCLKSGPDDADDDQNLKNLCENNLASLELLTNPISNVDTKDFLWKIFIRKTENTLPSQ